MKLFACALIATAAIVNAAGASADTVTVDSLRNMSQTELNDVYLAAEPGPMPDGDSHGTAVFFPGSILNTPATLLAAMVWQGKVFDTENGVLLNKVFGFHLVKARLFEGESLFDGRRSNIIDYSETSVLARQVRDEIRMVAPNLYLGRAYMRTLLGDYMVVNFILDFN